METLLAFLQELGLNFIPLFVAMDAIGVLPILLALTQHMEPRERIRMVHYATITALALGLVFLAIGKGIFWVLGIEVSDFLVAGGVILLLIAVKDLVVGRLADVEARISDYTLGVVPLGTPLITGPAVLTTLLLLVEHHPLWVVVLSFILNLGIAWGLMLQANRVARLMGPAGMRATSKVISLLLAAIAIKMIRQGLSGFLGG